MKSRLRYVTNSGKGKKMFTYKHVKQQFLQKGSQIVNQRERDKEKRGTNIKKITKYRRIKYFRFFIKTNLPLLLI